MVDTCSEPQNLTFSFSHLGFCSGNFFLIVPFPDDCLLVPYKYMYLIVNLVFSHLGSFSDCAFS